MYAKIESERLLIICLNQTKLYSEVPTYYTWNANEKSSERRKRDESVDGQPNIFKETTIGRIYTIHPNQDERFFFSMLLVNAPGPTSFKHLKTVNRNVLDTYRSSCQALDLFENDQHWSNCINDKCEMSTPSQICAWFRIILTTCSPSSPTELWKKYKSQMAEDLLHQIQLERSDMTLNLTTDIYNWTLVMIEDVCLSIANKLLSRIWECFHLTVLLLLLHL